MMRRRNVTVVLLSGLCLAGCAGLPQWVRGTGEVAGTAHPTQAPAAHSDATGTEARVRELEDRLAAREREIVAARQEIASLRSASTPGSQGQSGASSGFIGAEAVPLVADRAAATTETEEEARFEAERVKRQLASTEAQLGRERRRRKILEQDLANLREETASSPFERQQDAVLAKARIQIARLERELAAQKAEREDLAARYAALRAQVEASVSTRGGRDQEPRVDLAPLESEQASVLAELRRELAASRASEGQLRAALNTQARGSDFASSSELQRLAAENSALQTRLAEERQANQDLAAKLKAAMRVTDLIFRMQGETSAVRAPEAQR